MVISNELKLDFKIFCQNEFNGKSLCANENKKTQWIFVQAGTFYGNNLHYEFGKDEVQLHIEIDDSVQIQKFLFENINNTEFEWRPWGKPNHCCVIKRSITTKNELFSAFCEIRDKIEPIILEFEQKQKKGNSIQPKMNEDNTSVKLDNKTLGEIFQVKLDDNNFIVKCEQESDIFKPFDLPLSIPDYQRAYEWRTDHVRNLFNDTFDTSKKKSSYLLGTIILHKTKDNFEIVDGQQRLITLTILLINLCLTNDEIKLQLLNSTFDNVKSFFYIKNTNTQFQTLLNGKSAEQKKQFLNFLINKVRFSILTVSGTNALDQAYTFFDSLNSKGKGLSDFDLLKAHHLMFIPEEQESLARQHNDYWQSKDYKHQKLFSSILRRIRMWSRGMERDTKAERNNFYEFISAVEPNELEQNEHLFNRYMQPGIFRSWCRENDQIVLNMKTPQNNTELSLPMEIPQTIEGGDSFFLYAKRYHGLYAMLFERNDDNKSTSLQYASNLSNSISNDYLKMAFEAVVLLYYDKFGEQRLIEIATCAELIISERRFTWSNSRPSPIRIEGTLSDIKIKNLIPIILNSTVSSHVISQLNIKINTTNRSSINPNTKNISPTVKNYMEKISMFYNQNKSKIKNSLLLEKVDIIYNSNEKGDQDK